MRLVAAIAIVLVASTVSADPLPYRLQPELSTVGFSYVMAGQTINGRMPVEAAQIALDLGDPSQSRVQAVLRPDKADAGPDFATAAMRGESVLDTARHPRITFESRRITETGPGAALVDGEITIRGVTRPIRLEANFYRQSGTASDDTSKLQILMKGVISRQAFGAAGFGGFVGDRIDLTILARVERRN